MSDNLLRGKRVLITGGQGFIGSNLALRLADLDARLTLVDCLLPGAGGNVHNIVSLPAEARIIQGDLRDPASPAIKSTTSSASSTRGWNGERQAQARRRHPPRQ